MKNQEKSFIDYVFDLPVIDMKTKYEICRRHIKEIKRSNDDLINAAFERKQV